MPLGGVVRSNEDGIPQIIGGNDPKPDAFHLVHVTFLCAMIPFRTFS